MSIAFQCPGCFREITVRDELAGRKGKCPGCGAIISVPSRNDPIPAPPETSSPPPVFQGAASLHQRERRSSRFQGRGTKGLQHGIVIAALSLVGLVCLFPPVVSLDEPTVGQSAGRRFLFATEFSRRQIEDAGAEAWERTEEGKALKAQMSQAEKEFEQAGGELEQTRNTVPYGSPAYDDAASKWHKALGAESSAHHTYYGAAIAAGASAVRQAVASRWPFSGIIRARDYGRAFMECIVIAVLTAIAFLFVRFRQRRQEHACE